MIKQNIVQIFEKSILNNWDLPAFSNYKGETLKYKDVAKKIFYLHYIFNNYGIKKGDKIALLGYNSINWAVTYLSVITYGAVIVPVLPDFHRTDIQHILKHSDSALLFVSDDCIDTINEDDLKMVRAIFSLNSFRQIHSTRFDFFHMFEKNILKYAEKIENAFNKSDVNFNSTITSDQIAAIVYTSGTSGFSKGVMLPYKSLTVNILYAQEVMPLKSCCSIISILPLAHAFGCSFEFLYPFSIGCHVTFLGKLPSPKLLTKAFSDIKPYVILTVPLIIEKIYKKSIVPLLNKKIFKLISKLPLAECAVNKIIKRKLLKLFGGKLVELVIGGAPLNPHVDAFLQKIRFPYTVGYGMTECGPLISYAPVKEHKFMSAGKVIHYLDIKIDSSNPESTAGEILVRGENVMSGYYKNDEETKTVIDDDGWLHTGDLGIIDKQNTIYIFGRLKNVILGPSGQNIYPEEIEAKLNSLAYVQESLIIEENGKLTALIYPDFEAFYKQNLGSKEIKEIMEINKKLINGMLPSYSYIHKIKLHTESFEKTPTKKIKRYIYEHEQPVKV